MRWKDNSILWPFFDKIAIHRKKALFSILAVLLLAGMACNLEPLMKPAGSYKFIPFSNSDCNAPGLPKPSGYDVESNAASIYCQFTGIISGQGVAFLTLNYAQDPAVARTGYDNYHKVGETGIAAAAQAKGNIKSIYDLTDELMYIVVYPNKAYPNPDDGLCAVLLYNSHFVINVKGSVTNTYEPDAAALLQNLISYAEKTADSHYVFVGK